jgi:hypothetical protein
MTSPLCQAPAICPEEGFDVVQNFLHALLLVLGLALTQAAGATTTNHDDHKLSAAPKRGYLYSKDNND